MPGADGIAFGMMKTMSCFGGVMVAALLGSISFDDLNDHLIADHFQDASSGAYGEMEEESGEVQPAFVRGSVLDAFAAHDRVERANPASHIAAIDSDDNGLYRLFRTP